MVGEILKTTRYWLKRKRCLFWGLVIISDVAIEQSWAHIYFSVRSGRSCMKFSDRCVVYLYHVYVYLSIYPSIYLALILATLRMWWEHSYAHPQDSEKISFIKFWYPFIRRYCYSANYLLDIYYYRFYFARKT